MFVRNSRDHESARDYESRRRQKKNFMSFPFLFVPRSFMLFVKEGIHNFIDCSTQLIQVMKKSMPVAKSAPSAPPAAKRPAAVAVGGGSTNASATDPMLMDTYQQSDDSMCDVANDLDAFDARLSNPQRRAAGPVRTTAPKRSGAQAQFKPHQAPAKAPAPVVFRKGAHGPALTEENDDTREQDVQDVRNLGEADCSDDD